MSYYELMLKKSQLFIPRSPAKPLLRGHSHLAAFFFSLGAILMLIAKTNNFLQLVSILVYAFSLIFLFGVSSLYHLLNWAPEYRAWMKRLDHCAIYILIAGTGTPLSLLSLSEPSAIKLLTLTWSVVAFGIFQSLFWIKAPKWVSAILYLFAGWVVIPFWQEFKLVLSSDQISFIIMGGVSYSLGAIAYALKKPNPIPNVFGYHEVFHVLVIVGAMLHFLAVNSLVK